MSKQLTLSDGTRIQVGILPLAEEPIVFFGSDGNEFSYGWSFDQALQLAEDLVQYDQHGWELELNWGF